MNMGRQWLLEMRRQVNWPTTALLKIKQFLGIFYLDVLVGIEESVEILWKEKQFKLFVTEEMGAPFSPLLEEDKEDDGISDTNSFLHRDDDEEEGEFRPENLNDEEDDFFRESPPPPPPAAEKFSEDQENRSRAMMRNLPQYIPPDVDCDTQSSFVAETIFEEPPTFTREASSHHSFGDPQFSGTHDPTNEAHPNPKPDSNPISLSSDPNQATDPNPISLNSDPNPPLTNPQSEPQPCIDNTSYQIPDLNSSFPTSQACPSIADPRPKNRGSPKVVRRRPPLSIKLKDMLRPHRSSQPSSQRHPVSSSRRPQPIDLISQRSNSEQEVLDTIEIGNCLGFKLDEFRLQSHRLVTESGVETMPT
ncbi:hypothetical protein LXL04_007692 [Taraxacum kok-saghyz]